MDPWERLRQDDDDACENYDFFKLVDDIIDTAEHDNAKGDFLESSIEWVIRVLKKAEEWPEESSSLLKEAADSFSDRARYLDKFISQTDNVKGTIPTKERAIELYKKAEKKAESFDDFYGLADSIADTNRVGDKEWAKKLFKKAEGKAESSYDYKSVADGIAEAGFSEFLPKDSKFRVMEAQITLVRSGRGGASFSVKSPQVPLSRLSGQMRKGENLVIEIKRVARANFQGKTENFRNFGPRIISIPLN